MKILLINQTFYPDHAATAQQLVDLAQYLVKQGHQVTVLAGQRGYDNREVVYSRREIWNGIEIRRVPSTGLGKHRIRYRVIDSLTFDLALVWALLTTPKHDVVISFTSPPLVGVLGNLFCFLKGGHCVQWLMDVNPDAAFAVGYLNPKSVLGRFLNWAFETSCRASDQVIVLDRWMKRKIEAHGVKSKRIAVVPPWPVLDTDIDGIAPMIAEFKKRNGLLGKFIILFSGNHSVVHPFETLLEGALQLRDRHDVAFVFMGKGMRSKDVIAFKTKHRLENIYQLPPQPRELLKGAFGSADLQVVVIGEAVAGLVHTSKIYGILASGKPFLFLGPSDTHLGDLLKECPTGFQVDHGNVSRLVEIILHSTKLTSAEKYEIQKRSLEYVTTEYSPEKTLGSFSKQILSGPAEAISLHEPHFDSTKEFR